MKAPSPLSLWIWGTQEFRKTQFHSQGGKSCLLRQRFAKPFTNKYYIKSLRLKVKYKSLCYHFSSRFHQVGQMEISLFQCDWDSVPHSEGHHASYVATDIIFSARNPSLFSKDLLRNTVCDFHREFQSQELRGHSKDSHNLRQISELSIHSWLSVTKFTPSPFLPL